MGMPVISHSDTTICQALVDMAQSIAMEEAAIAHILNAEGEKIQKMLQLPSITIKEMIEINQSVNCMVNQLNEFEQILLSKLDRLDIPDLLNITTGKYHKNVPSINCNTCKH